MKVMTSILIPVELDRELERIGPPELRGNKKSAARVARALRQYLANVAGQAGTSEQVAATGDETPKPVTAGSKIAGS